MSLISLIVALAVIGFALWLVTTYIPMPEPFKRIIIVVIVLVLIVWLLQIFGVTGPMVPRLGR